MNKDQIKGKGEQVAGAIKQKVGEAVDNQGLANRGLNEQIKGAARETWGNAREAVHEVGKEHQHEAGKRANDARDRMSHKVQDVKDRVNEKIDANKEQAKESIKERRSA